MKLLIPPQIRTILINALNEAGKREIGGIVMGEHLAAETFRITEITVQRKKGTFATFVRIVAELLAPLRAFFEATKHNYTHFNYLGEWHSHHSFDLEPSGRDHSTMRDMVMDSQLGAHFLVLMLVKLSPEGNLESSLTIYQPNKCARLGRVVQEPLH